MKRLLALVLCLQLGCVSSLSRREDAPKHTFEHRCRPVQALPKGLMPYGTMPDSPLSANEINALAAATQFTPQSLGIAQAIGALHLLVRLPAAERAVRQKTGDARQQLEVLRVEVSDRILLALLQVTGMSAEIVCEAERADQLADRLEEKEDSRARLITVAAIVVAGLAGIVGGAVAIANQSVIEGILGVVGGTLSTVFSSFALKQDLATVFLHPRNILIPVWNGPEQTDLFPEVVWRFLNRPLEEDPSATLRTAIIARWQRDGRLGTPGSAVERHRLHLFFTEGGEYQVEDLRARAQMLDMLDAQVGLMNQYLEGLLAEVLARGSLVQ